MPQVSRAPVAKAGLGLTFVKPDGAPGVVIKRVKEGGAAEATQRIFPGDRVMEIDDTQLVEVSSKMLSSVVMGPDGSHATLKVATCRPIALWLSCLLGRSRVLVSCTINIDRI